MAKKRVAHKAELWVDHDNDDTFTKIAGVRALADPSLTREAVDVTDLDDTIEQGLPSPTLKVGDITFTLFWDEADTAGQGLIEDLVTAATPDEDVKFQLRLLFPDGTINKEFTGWVKELGAVNYEVKTEVTREAMIHVNSLATVT